MYIPKVTCSKVCRVWSVIKSNTNSYWDYCHATGKSEAIECARRCHSTWLTEWRTGKEQSEKMEGQGGGEAQGVLTGQPPASVSHVVHIGDVRLG
jgi:hypothetical protein